MTCLCGDTNCWSCGPAQGFDPAFERVMEGIGLLLDPREFDTDEEETAYWDGVTEVINKLSKFTLLAQMIDIASDTITRLDRNKVSPNSPLGEKKINDCIEAIRPCPIHNRWPFDGYCSECLVEEEEKLKDSLEQYAKTIERPGYEQIIYTINYKK